MIRFVAQSYIGYFRADGRLRLRYRFRSVSCILHLVSQFYRASVSGGLS
jgi:hypothetical protein